MTANGTIWLDSLMDLDLATLAQRGVQGVLFDVDNTLLAPRHHTVAPELVEHLLRERERSGVRRWALASNTLRDLSLIASALGAETMKASRRLRKPRLAYFRAALDLLELRPEQVVMIGDRIVHDIAPPARLGMHTVLVRPMAPDQLVDFLFLRRRRERARREQIMSASGALGSPPDVQAS